MVEPMSTAFSVVFGPIVRTFTWLFDTWKDTSKENIELRRRAWSEHFEPAYARLETIHKDYLESFHKFYDACRKFETPSRDLLAAFRSYGMQYTTWREDVRAFGDVSRAMAEQFRKPDQKSAILEFSKAIDAYFQVSIASGEKHHWPSWFSHFIDEFERHIREGRSPWDSDYSSTGDINAKNTFIDKLKSAYEKELPAKWKAIAAAKARLQVVFDLR